MAVTAAAFLLPIIVARNLPLAAWARVAIGIVIAGGLLAGGATLLRRLNRRVPAGFESIRQQV